VHFLERLVESPTARLPSGNPLDLLPTRQFLIFLAAACRRNMTQTAGLLSISRETLYQELRRAHTALTRIVPGERPKSPRCRLCGNEPRMPGRLVGRRCHRAWERTYRKHRRAALAGQG
jgi:hypothetical protein